MVMTVWRALVESPLREGSAMSNRMDEVVGRMRVVKKLSPSDRGAIKPAEQFGANLVCVRHRVNP